MTKFSLNSPPKSRRFLLPAVLIFVSIVIAIDVSLTVFINRKLNKIVEDVALTNGYVLKYRLAFFNLFQGVVITGLEFDKEGEVLFKAHRLDLGFDLWSLISERKILIKNIGLSKSRFYLDKTSDMLSYFKTFLKQGKVPIDFFPTVNFKASNLWYEDAVQLDARGYFSSIMGRFYSSRGQVHLKYIAPTPMTNTDIFKGSHFYRPFDFVFEAEAKGDDLFISRLQFSNRLLKFAGSGAVTNYLTKPEVAIDLKALNIILDDFRVLNAEHVKAEGVLDLGLRLAGSMADLKTFVSIRVTNVQLAFFDALFLTKINGTAFFIGDHLVMQQLALSINGVPFRADASLYGGATPRLLARLSSLARLGKESVFVLNLDSRLIDNALQGEIATRLRYASGKAANNLDFILRDFRMGYDDDLFLKAKFLNISFFIETPEEGGDIKKIEKNINLENLFCIIRKEKEGFVLDHIKAVCYKGNLDGVAHFLSKDEALSLQGEAHVRGVDLNDFSAKTKNLTTVLLGQMAGDLKFDSTAEDLLKGQVFVTDGLVEQNSLLNAVADFLGVASLKKVAFKNLSIFFNGGKGEYTSQITLESERVNSSLEGKITDHDKVDGFLTLALATDLLKESAQFKKILIYIKHDQPQVVFPFKISSYIESPRVLWLKNEFKEKLQNLLPERNKRFLQRQVNDVVERMRAE